MILRASWFFGELGSSLKSLEEMSQGHRPYSFTSKIPFESELRTHEADAAAGAIQVQASTVVNHTTRYVRGINYMA